MIIYWIRRLFVASTFLWCASLSQSMDNGAECTECMCYTDGFVLCGERNLTSFPALPSNSVFVEAGENLITNIEYEDFQGLIKVIFLNLSNNQIQVLRAGVFSSLSNLLTINLDGNLITTIENCAFNGLPRLTHIQLQSNRISMIGERAFDSLPAIETLALFNNLLTSFHIRWFEGKDNLTTLTTASNRWDCTCQLKQDYQFVIETYPNIATICPPPFLQNTIFNQLCIQCMSPIYLGGQLLHNIQNCSQTPTTQQNNPVSENSTNSYCDLIVSAKTNERVMNTTQLTTTMLPTSDNLEGLPTWQIVLIALSAFVMFVGIILIFIFLFKSIFSKKPKDKNTYTEGNQENIQNNATTV